MRTMRIAEVDTPADLRALAFRELSQNFFEQTHRKIFDLSLNEEVIRIRRQIELRAARLGDVFDISFGLKTGDDEKFIGPRAPSRLYKALLRGENVQRYQLDFRGEYVRYAPAEMKAHRRTARPGTAARFERPKVLVGDTGRGIRACYDPGRYYAKDVLIVAAKTKAKSDTATVRLKALTGILNSRLMSYYYSLAFPTLHLQRSELAELPLPERFVAPGKPDADIAGLADMVDRAIAVKLEAIDGTSEAIRGAGLRQLENLERRIDGLVFALYGLDSLVATAVLRATGEDGNADPDSAG